MEYLSIQSMKTMRYMPELDWKQVGYAVSWIVAIAASTLSVVVFT